MKKIFASIVLPNLAAAAIIGSGFSVWFFGENQDKASTTASIIVENRLKIGEVYMDEGEVHVFDDYIVEIAINNNDIVYICEEACSEIKQDNVVLYEDMEGLYNFIKKLLNEYKENENENK